ncbi:hypothetical protein PPYR_02927 [Photinus pyralis]|uniref:Uncharacterized protein n=1 Tax=Photinus pyralis TaxID=7054 RepID=A0A5N4A1C6_PHOPY|nr:hypothetical protein PPYR_02927 [Photinus pyralis]
MAINGNFLKYILNYRHNLLSSLLTKECNLPVLYKSQKTFLHFQNCGMHTLQHKQPRAKTRRTHLSPHNAKQTTTAVIGQAFYKAIRKPCITHLIIVLSTIAEVAEEVILRRLQGPTEE